MRAWQVREWCEPDGMEFCDLAPPDPQPGQVRVRNRAAALNFFDILQIQGKYQSKMCIRDRVRSARKNSREIPYLQGLESRAVRY